MSEVETPWGGEMRRNEGEGGMRRNEEEGGNLGEELQT